MDAEEVADLFEGLRINNLLNFSFVVTGKLFAFKVQSVLEIYKVNVKKLCCPMEILWTIAGKSNKNDCEYVPMLFIRYKTV